MSLGPAGAPATGGLIDALRAMGGTLNELIRVRGELFALEWREEMLRRKRMLVLATLAAALLHTALLLFAFLVIAAMWDTHRLAAIAAVGGLYVAFGAATLARLRIESAPSPGPFAASLAELDRDLAQLNARR